MTILWVMAILSLIVFSACQFLLFDLESQANASGEYRAELLAERGLAYAAHPEVKPGDALLTQRLNELESFTARISSEGARLHLNELLLKGERDREVLEELFFSWGVRRERVSVIVDHLMDWVDADDNPTGHGAERAYYMRQNRRNQPYNRPFLSLQEVLPVAGFDEVMEVRPDWMDSFTLLSSGPLDLEVAPAELIAVACRCPLEAARRFVVLRNGHDGLPDTEDDLVIESVEVVLDLLGVAAADREVVVERLRLNEPVKRLVAVGRYGSIEVERVLTVQYSGGRGQILRSETRRIQ